jgi:hypothetical protein
MSDMMTGVWTLPKRRAASADPLGPIAAELSEYVRLRWPAYYPDRANMGDPVLRVTPRHFGYSVILQVDLAFPNGSSERFMMKIRRQQKHGSFVRTDLSEAILDSSRAEYHQHQKAYEFFAGRPALSVVRPLDFVESHNALVVAHAEGEDLGKLVKAGKPISSPALRWCGEWWRLFHRDLHRASDRAWDPALVDAATEQRFIRLRKFGVPEPTLAAIGSQIHQAARRTEPVMVPVGVAHGDCKLRHVWARPDGIQVLDFGNAKVADVWIDPAALVAELALYSLWTTRMAAVDQVPHIRVLVESYFEGAVPPAFGLYVVDVLLKKWHRRLRNWGPGAGLTRLRDSLRIGKLDRHVERLYIDRWFTEQVRAWAAFAEGRPPAWLAPVLEKPCR